MKDVLVAGPEYILALDVGGTKIHTSLVQIQEDSYTIITQTKVQTYSDGSQLEVLAQLTHCVSQLLDTRVKCICIGFPSTMNQRTGTILETTNIPSLQHVEIRKHFQKQFHIPIYIQNDANCFALGAYLQHKSHIQNDEVFVGITLGTGVGCGVITQGNILTGIHTAAAEIWQLPYLDGTIEQYASSKFFESKHISAKDCFLLAKQNDARAVTICAEFAKHVAHVLFVCIVCYNPTKIAIGGSIAKGHEFFAEDVLSALQQKLTSVQFSDIDISYVIDSDVVIKGVAHLAHIR